VDADLSTWPVEPSHDDLVELLIDVGEITAGMADTFQPEHDDEIPALAPWRAVLCAIAAAVCASWRDDRAGLRHALDTARRTIGALRQRVHPATIETRVAEGFAQFGLFPEQYIQAAEEFAASDHPVRVLCIGLRSIGEPLAAIVSATLLARGVPSIVRSVRPRGDPWDRRVALGEGLRETIRRYQPSHILIVDEGPGLSGSSFAGAAEALVACGCPPERVILCPSWDAPVAALRSVRARAVWTRHRRFVASFESTWIATGRLGAARAMEDLSAGLWRPRVFGVDSRRWPAVHPQHERRKYLEDGRRLLRFAGLGRHGRARLARAHALAEAGFGARTLGLRHGFLEQDWVDGHACRTLRGRAAADRIARYLAVLRRSYATSRAARVGDLIEMMRHNLAEAKRPWGAPLERLTACANRFDEPEVEVDGRLLPQEWIAAHGTLVKVDALDHHADDFLPGCRDAAWDVAGALVEADFDRADRQHLVCTYAKCAGDRTVAHRLPFYLAAYSAYRLGYVSLAAHTLGETPDGWRFRRAARRYRRWIASPLPVDI
jgi:hypothetical protein